jgi:hypothetical protein
LHAIAVDTAGNASNEVTIQVNAVAQTVTCPAGQHLDTVTNTCVPDTTGGGTQGAYEGTFNVVTPDVGTLNNGQTVTYAPTIPPYPTMIAESNEPAIYQGDMQCSFSINGGAFVAAARVSTSSDQWRLTIPSPSTTWHNGSNTMVIKFTYINGWVKQGTIIFNVTGASAYGRVISSYAINSNRFLQHDRFGPFVFPHRYR